LNSFAPFSYTYLSLQVEYKQNEFKKGEEILREALNKGLSTATSKNIASSVPILPISAWEGENVHELSRKMAWMQEKRYLASYFRSCSEKSYPYSLVTQPFVYVVHDTRKISGVGLVICGRVISGVLRTKNKRAWRKSLYFFVHS